VAGFAGQPPAGSVRATASGGGVLSSRAAAQGTREGSRRRRRRARARPPIYGGARRRRRDAGPDGPRAGLRQRSGLGRASGSAQSGRVDFSFFPNLFLMRKQIPEKSRNCLKARKILRKSQKFQENS
jgi:hypothetical protein